MYTWEKMELYMVRGSEEASMPGEDQANYFPAQKWELKDGCEEYRERNRDWISRG